MIGQGMTIYLCLSVAARSSVSNGQVIFFVSNTIPFGWKLSAYIYHSTGLLASHLFRTIGSPCTLYIDDATQLLLHISATTACYDVLATQDRNFQLASSAIFLVCYFLVELGYTFGIEKSKLTPSKRVAYLGFVSDSTLQAFCLTNKKKSRLLLLINEILQADMISLLQLS